MRAGQALFRLVSIFFDLAQDVLRFLLLGTRSSAALKAENIFLRKQLALLSFAKIAYGDISLRCNAFITVMQAAELWDLNDPSDTRDLPRKGTLLVEPQMRPRPVVVSEIRSQGSPQMVAEQGILVHEKWRLGNSRL